MRGDELLHAVIEHPDDTHTRLVYADWLEDQGEVDRAILIRMQAALVDVPEHDYRWIECRSWAADHPDAHAQPPLPAGVRWSGPYRAIPERLGVLDVDAFLAHAPELFANAPIRALDVDAREAHFRLDRLVASRWLDRITEIRFTLGSFGSEQIRQLEQLTAIESLELGYEGVTAEGLHTLVGCRFAQRLETLVLPYNFFLRHGLGIEAFREAKLPRLRHLDVRKNRIDGSMVRAITENPSLGLTRLSLSENPIGDAGWRAIAESKLPLEHLDLGKTHPRVAGVRALASSPLARTLETLKIDHDKLGPQAIAALLSSPWPELEFLDISSQRFTESALFMLATTSAFPKLQRADLRPLPTRGYGDSPWTQRLAAWFESTTRMRSQHPL